MKQIIIPIIIIITVLAIDYTINKPYYDYAKIHKPQPQRETCVFNANSDMCKVVEILKK